MYYLSLCLQGQHIRAYVCPSQLSQDYVFNVFFSKRVHDPSATSLAQLYVQDIAEYKTSTHLLELVAW